MKEKVGVIFIVLVALLCLFGCSSDRDLEERDMVQTKLCPATIQCEDLPRIIGRHI